MFNLPFLAYADAFWLQHQDRDPVILWSHDTGHFYILYFTYVSLLTLFCGEVMEAFAGENWHNPDAVETFRNLDFHEVP